VICVFQDMATMGETIEQCCGHLGVAEHGGPFTELRSLVVTTLGHPNMNCSSRKPWPLGGQGSRLFVATVAETRADRRRMAVDRSEMRYRASRSDRRACSEAVGVRIMGDQPRQIDSGSTRRRSHLYQRIARPAATAQNSVAYPCRPGCGLIIKASLMPQFTGQR
jgi:hypothetical protein